jgi:hypothetical protein
MIPEALQFIGIGLAIGACIVNTMTINKQLEAIKNLQMQITDIRHPTEHAPAARYQQ